MLKGQQFNSDGCMRFRLEAVLLVLVSAAIGEAQLLSAGQPPGPDLQVTALAPGVPRAGSL